MNQAAAILTKVGAIQLEFPDPESDILPGVQWGRVEAFPTPAYWRYQVLARRLMGQPPDYKVGNSFSEEVGACILSGHGIPANIAIAAFQHLRDRGVFGSEAAGEANIHRWLSEPIQLGERTVRYRFAARKAQYLARALPLVPQIPQSLSGRALRDWLLRLPGVGFKTASMIVRNWQRADDVAILDIHLLRVGQVIGLFPMHLTVERNYLDLEARFLRLANALDLRAAELDALIWYEMASSPLVTRDMIEYLDAQARPAVRRSGKVQFTQPVAAE